jgi:predicted nucleotidyltransferase
MSASNSEVIIQQLEKILGDDVSIKVAFVYGSLAKGGFRPDSDIDLAVAGDKPFTDDEKVSLMTSLSLSLKREIDLIDLNTATGTVFKQALTTGRLVVMKDANLLARCASRMVFDEADFQIFRRKLMAERKRKVFRVE